MLLIAFIWLYLLFILNCSWPPAIPNSGAGVRAKLPSCFFLFCLFKLMLWNAVKLMIDDIMSVRCQSCGWVVTMVTLITWLLSDGTQVCSREKPNSF